MRLVVLGSGTSVPHPQRAAAAFWLRQQMVWFCSIAAQTQPSHGRRKAWTGRTLMQSGSVICIWIIVAVWCHSVGLEVGATNPRETKAARIFGCPGIGSLLKAIDKSNNYGLLTQPFPIELHEVSDDNAGLK